MYSKISCSLHFDHTAVFSSNSSVSSIVSLFIFCFSHLLSPPPSPHCLPPLLFFSSSPPAGTSWFAWSAWRPRCQGREGTSRSYRSHWTPRRAGREGRQRSARASGNIRTKRRDCKSDHVIERDCSTITIHTHLDHNI